MNRYPQKHSKYTAKAYQRHYVQHNYHDHALENKETCTVPVNHKNAVVKEPFPVKLHRMISASISTDEDVVCWMPHGRAFIVRSPAEFVRKLMPRFFKQTKWTSFQRQLNLYGFQRITKGPDTGAYYHELFLLDREFLAARIVRQKVKGTGIKGANNPEEEPDFYSMPPVRPTSSSQPQKKFTSVNPSSNVNLRSVTSEKLPVEVTPAFEPRTHEDVRGSDPPLLHLSPSAVVQESVSSKTSAEPDYWNEFAMNFHSRTSRPLSHNDYNGVVSDMSDEEYDHLMDFNLDRFDPLYELMDLGRDTN